MRIVENAKWTGAPQLDRLPEWRVCPPTVNMNQSSPQHNSRPGQMTAVMRAVKVLGPKVLRIGVVVAGQVVEERLLTARKDVSVGPNERSDFVLSSRSLRKGFILFQRIDDGYALNFLESMTGRVALPTGVSELEMLRGQARRLDGGLYQVRLSEDSRGKVVLGDTTFLFQFVAPPPVLPKPQLPGAVLRGAGGIDWRTTIIAAFAFFVHFMAIGAMYTDWLDPVVDEQLTLAGLLETMDQLPPPPAVEEKPEDDPKDESEKVEEKAKPDPKPQETKMPDQPGQKLNQAQTAALSSELDQLSMMTLGALGTNGPATAGVLQEGEISTGALDAAAQSGAGVGVGGDLKLGGGGGPIQPGQSGSLAGIGSTTKGSSATGSVQEVKGPKGSASVSSSVAAGAVTGASSVVAQMSAGFRRCYQRGLDQNPDISGSIRLTIQVGPGGGVSSVSGSTTGNIPESIVACVKARAQAAQFNPPDGGSAVINVPISFVKQ